MSRARKMEEKTPPRGLIELAVGRVSSSARGFRSELKERIHKWKELF